MDQVAPAPEIPLTSEIPFFSSLHGKERRDLRGIDRRDLQAAVKHGTKKPGWPHPQTGAIRWKYTWANIVYITDETSTQEVTSYAEPLAIPHAELTPANITCHEAAKHRLKEDPFLCTSHTVIVVDQSGSMKTCDVFDFKDRSKAAFGMLATDFVAKQWLSGEATDADVVSLVLMRDDAEVAFKREPMGLALYNKFVCLHDNGIPYSHGNFLPALDKAEALLKDQCHGGCALSLLFLSDGKPSDKFSPWFSGLATQEALISDRMALLAKFFGEQLSVSTLGFAKRDQDFSVLEDMATAARGGGACGAFHRPELSADGLGTAIAHSVSTLTATRTRLTALATQGGNQREFRKVEREAAGSFWNRVPARGTGDASDWAIYTKDVQRYKFSPTLQRSDSRRPPWELVKFCSDIADGITMRVKCLGEGAERVVFGLQVRACSTAVFEGAL